MSTLLTDRLLAFVEGRSEAPAADFNGVDELIRAIRVDPPERGVPLGTVLDLVMAAGEKGHDTTGPGWLAYVPGGGLVTAAFADLVARVTNRFVTVWEAAPVMAEIEATAIRWLCGLFDYDETARGIFTTGGSLANFSAIVSARHSLLGEAFLDGVLYVTSETHGSIAKAAALAGFPRSALRLVPTTPLLRMDLGALLALIDEDRRAGRRPCAIIASAGTTNTGAVDPIAELAQIAGEERIWLHVDGAYGGFFQLTDRGRKLFAGIERAESITLDPHKGMFLPYGTGALLVRNGRELRAAHEVHGPYLQDLAPEADIPNFSDYSAELSRDARGLRVWLPIVLHGLGAFRDALNEKLDLARYIYEALRSMPNLEVPWEPELSIVAFRVNAGEDQASDAATAHLLQSINATGRFVLSSTVVDGRFTIRIAVLSFRTHRDRIDELIDTIRRLASS
ncbi:MAG: aminotransferase class I/II-fold pyridoxal phosphate-dependent enzyme [Candidatus Dormibacteraceae bacterium]